MQPVYLFGILEFCNGNFNHSLFEIRYKLYPLASRFYLYKNILYWYGALYSFCKVTSPGPSQGLKIRGGGLVVLDGDNVPPPARDRVNWTAPQSPRLREPWSADFVLMSADVLLKMIIILSELRIAKVFLK